VVNECGVALHQIKCIEDETTRSRVFIPPNEQAAQSPKNHSASSAISDDMPRTTSPNTAWSPAPECFAKIPRLALEGAILAAGGPAANASALLLDLEAEHDTDTFSRLPDQSRHWGVICEIQLHGDAVIAERFIVPAGADHEFFSISIFNLRRGGSVRLVPSPVR